MAWRGRGGMREPRWEPRVEPRWEPRWEPRPPRPPVWEARRSPERSGRERERERDRERRYERDERRERRRDSPRERERHERRRSPHRSPRHSPDMPMAPSPPKISARSRSASRERSPPPPAPRDDRPERPDRPARDRPARSSEREQRQERPDRPERPGRSPERAARSPEDRPDQDSQITPSPGDWVCKCGSYNFKRRQVCYRRNCLGKRAAGVVYGAESDRQTTDAGITKRLLFRRLDALTTEEKILDALKDRCSKAVLDTIAGITIGRETLTGASKCLAYISFNSIADSTAALTELSLLKPPLEIDGREVLISYYYNDPLSKQKSNSNNANSAEYAAYYAQMQGYTAQSQSLSEADRVNAAAAVAQSAIFAAQARNMSWTPVAVPTFVPSTTLAAPKVKIPTGDGKTKYTAPDVRTFMYDETSGYYYDPNTGLYYDGNTQYFYNSQTNQYMYWDASSSTYIAATQTQQNTEQPKLPSPPEATTENTIVKEPEEKKKKEKEDKVKVAKKIAKDMERWARTLNQRKENARSNVVMEQPRDTSASKGSADIGFSVLGAGPSLPQPAIVREISPPLLGDDFLIKKSTVAEPIDVDSDDGIIDWAKLTCLLCKRKFPSVDVLTKHKTMSDLHKQNLAEHKKQQELLPQTNGYRDRAAERRMKFGEDEPIIRKRYEPPDVMPPPMPSAPPPNVADTIGGKMLQKMGWSEGRGLGKTEQGRIAPIEAEQRPALVGLGQKKGIYTPTAGETYRDTVKKLMIARYKEVVGQEDGD